MLVKIGEENDVDLFVGGGDITEAKDNHPGKLVNTVVDGLQQLTEVAPVILLRGNHDGIDANHSYWRWLQNLDGVTYIDRPRYMEPFDDSDSGFFLYETSCGKDKPFLFLPHSRDPLNEWKDIDMEDKIVFTHVTVHNCVSESGFLMESPLDVSFFEKANRVYSGDIHKSQTIGNLVYVGCPYNVRFGDGFDGRVLLVDTEDVDQHGIPKEVSFYLPFPRKIVFDVESAWEFEEKVKKAQVDLSSEATYLGIPRMNPQAKVRLHLTLDNLDKWREINSQIRGVCRDYQIELVSFELTRDYNENDGFVTYHGPKDFNVRERRLPQKEYQHFCDKEGIDGKLKETGEEIMKEIFS